MLLVTSAVANSVILNYIQMSSACNSERNNLFGDLFSTSLFLTILCLLNFHTFNPESFCLINPAEKMCDPHREALSCAQQHNLNVTSEVEHYFAGYAGFFHTNSAEESRRRKTLKCFLDIGRNSWFHFMSLDFGKNRRWTESSFVLIDGEFAPFQPTRLFNALPSINFGWLLDHQIPTEFGEKTTSTGILVFAADSHVQLFYRAAKMTGLIYFGSNLSS